MGKRSSRKKRNKKTPIKINPIVKQILIGVATGTLVHILGKLIDLMFQFEWGLLVTSPSLKRITQEPIRVKMLIELLKVVAKVMQIAGIVIIVASLGRGFWYLITKYLDNKRRR